MARPSTPRPLPAFLPRRIAPKRRPAAPLTGCLPTQHEGPGPRGPEPSVPTSRYLTRKLGSGGRTAANLDLKGGKVR